MKHHKIEQNTPEWDELRMGRITASQAHVLYMKESSETYKDYRFKLAYERVFKEPFPDKWNGNAATEAGHEREQAAIEAYENKTFYKVEKPGFFELNEYVGCSPDGLVDSDGLVEIKSIISGKVYRKKIDNGFKPEDPHKEQCMFQLLVTGRKWVDLVYYPPTTKAKIIINRIERDQSFLEDMEQRISSLNTDVMKQIEIIKQYG